MEKNMDCIKCNVEPIESYKTVNKELYVIRCPNCKRAVGADTLTETREMWEKINGSK